MNRPANRFKVKPLCLAVFAGLLVQAPAIAQSDEDEVMDEVVATGTRLKGTATAVLEERKNQAFVADILGAEQISRTGDSDAASALRRVTGLTLVDGKFIYVRGLGERYSSTQLNGAIVPTPDPTRNVIPLDLFPADIIESMSVQKSYSPSMPASFGGGNVDIRLKSIPSEMIFNMSGSIGTNSENSGDALGYAGGDDDWFGKDDGTRAVPGVIQDRWDSRNFLDNLDQATAVSLLKEVNRDYGTNSESVDPDIGLNMSVGNSFDLEDKWRAGFFVTAGYDSGTRVSEEYELNQSNRITSDTGEVRIIRDEFFDITSTEKSVKWSNLVTLGIDYDSKHRVDYSFIALNDTRDEISESVGQTQNISISENNSLVRDVDVVYEERTLYTNQIKGTHTFPEWNFMGFDWQYSLGRSSRNAPGGVEARFTYNDANEDGVIDAAERAGNVALLDAQTAVRYSFQELDDRLENWGYNFTLPYMYDRWEMEFKFGANFVSTNRTAENRRFDVNTLAFNDASLLAGNNLGAILSNQVLDTAEFSTSANRAIIRDTTIAGDDYVAARKVDAYYVEADFFYDNKWRVTGGVRWEDFRQTVAPLDPRTNQFDLTNEDAETAEERLSELAFQEDSLYPAVALTYFLTEEHQFRLSYGETVVRPDLREVSSATYLDPLTDFPISGTPGLKTTAIKNYDFRWEWYRDGGNNLSVGVFYKDMDSPIEAVQSPAQDGPPLIKMANAETGEVYGVEVEFLQGLDFIGGGVWDNLFASGNVTLSDSEIVLDTQSIVEQTKVSAAITNTTRRLTGHSEYVVNFQLGYDSDNGEHTASLVYNVFGDRILIPGIDGNDDNFEQPFHSLDAVYKFFPDFNTTLTFKLQNILDEQKEIKFEGVDRQIETRGTGASVSFKYEF